MSEAEKIQQFYNLLTTSVDVIRTFADKIPGFADLNRDDQELLFQSASLELFVLRLAHRYSPFCDNKISEQVQLQCVCNFDDEQINTQLEFIVFTVCSLFLFLNNEVFTTCLTYFLCILHIKNIQ